MNLKFTLYWIFVGIPLVVVFGQYRSIDGTLNNLQNPEWGSLHHELMQITSNGYSDSISRGGGLERPNARWISNQMFAQDEPIFDEQNHSDFVWVFGQFVDHDVVLVENDTRELMKIEIPEDDPVFSIDEPMYIFRSAGIENTGTSPDNPRKYANAITAFVDASSVYGSDEERARWLRTLEDGKLKTSYGNLLPWNTKTGEFNSPRDPQAPFMDDPMGLSPKHFVAGDVRANENPLLTTFHTLFVREHNRVCDELKIKNPALTDEELYQEARRWVSAYLQRIVYYEWLPAMGVSLPEYKGYRDDVNPQITNVFSAAAYRLGHTLINSNVLRLKRGGDEIPGGNIGLRDAFFNPLAISLVGTIDPYIRGMGSQVQQKMDCKVIDDVRNFLFGSPGAGGLDLAAINIARARERGLPDYNTIRGDIGLPEIKNFLEISNDAFTAQELERIYGDVTNIDPWVGMLAEDYMPNAMFGNTIMVILEEQFQRLRDGDRFYFESDEAFTPEEIEKIKSTTLRDIIMRNTDIKIMQDNVFEATVPEDLVEGPVLEVSTISAAIYPNPSPGIPTLKVYVDEDTEVQINVFDNQGSRVLSFSRVLQEGNNQIPLDLMSETGSMAYNVLVSKSEFEYTIARVIKL